MFSFYFFLISGLVFSIITISVVKDMKIFKKRDLYDYPISIYLWQILLLCLSYFIPIMGIASFIGFHIWFIIIYNGGTEGRTIVELNQKNLFHRIFLMIISILNKTIN